jgi:hypothetical protein
MTPTTTPSRTATVRDAVGITERLAALPPLDTAAFDPSAGAAGSLGRLRNVESDARWRCRYIRVRRDARVAALLPIYAATGNQWPDPAYAPSTWSSANGQPPGLTADRCLVVGGVYDRRTALHLPDDPQLVRAALTAAARVAAAEARCLVFPFMYERARRMLAAATGGRIAWSVLGREAHFRDVLRPDRERQLKSRVRGVLRRDRRLIDAAATTASVASWDAVRDRAADLIAGHNMRMGVTDHPEFVRMRYDQWSACDEVRVVAFRVEAGAVGGMLTALIWRDELDLYEIGLPESDHPARIAVYLDLLVHRPLAYATAHRLARVRAGTAAETPKASRGAAFEPLFGGVLDIAGTRMIADGTA